MYNLANQRQCMNICYVTRRIIMTVGLQATMISEINWNHLIAFASIEHLSSMKQYINMLLALLGWSVRISPAAWNDELVGPGRILQSIQSCGSRGSRVSSSQRLSAWTIWSASSVERARWSCHELRQTSAKSMDVWVLRGWQNSSLLYSSIKHCSSAMKFFNPITSDISTNLTGL